MQSDATCHVSDLVSSPVMENIAAEIETGCKGTNPPEAVTWGNVYPPALSEARVKMMCWLQNLFCGGLFHQLPCV
jgi:hypothetical protein